MTKQEERNIIITLGDPAGVGPYVTVKTLQKVDISPADKFILVGSKAVARRIKGFTRLEKKVSFVDIPCRVKITPGKINKSSGKAAWHYLQAAAGLVNKLKNSRLVTAPVSKEAIQQTVPDFSGHTEFLARYFKIEKFAMLMWGRKIKGITLTRHIPLAQAGFYLNKKSVLDSIILGWQFLCRFGRPKPIVLASFNPHAGVNTYLGREEKLLLSAKKQAQEIIKQQIFGPLPAEGVYRDMLRGKYSLVISPYHDQLMIPFKLLEFEQGVNITLGLPFLRVSPAHGTASDIAGRIKEISYASMQKAVELALRL